MDQLDPRTGKPTPSLAEELGLSWLLGEILRAPVRGVPTVEDLEREQGRLGIPGEAQLSRETGQGLLDWIAQAAGLAGILRGSAAGRQQELMSKGRGLETFGKEVLETSRRAYPKKWERIQSEQWRPFDESAAPWEETLQGRKSWQGGQRGDMPPEVSPFGDVRERLVRRQGPVPDEVRLGAGAYQVGETVPLPGGAMASYQVTPGPLATYVVELTYSTVPVRGQATRRTFQQGMYSSVGEATAKARQLATRLDLAARDMQAKGWYGDTNVQDRQLRLPWERGTSRPLTLSYPDERDPGVWRYEMFRPGTGRWSDEP